MKIIDVYWTKYRNRLIIECACGNKIDHPADKWKVHCNNCGYKENLGKIRESFLKTENKDILKC